MEKFDLYIGGKTCKPAGGECFESFDPYTGKPWAMVAKGGAADVERGSRLLVQRQVYDEVVSKVVKMARIARLGDPGDLATQVGADPVQAAGGRHRVDQYLPLGELHGTLRRLQAIQHRARKRHGDDLGISADQVRLDRHGQRHTQPVRAALRRSLSIEERS